MNFKQKSGLIPHTRAVNGQWTPHNWAANMRPQAGYATGVGYNYLFEPGQAGERGDVIMAGAGQGVRI